MNLEESNLQSVQLNKKVEISSITATIFSEAVTIEEEEYFFVFNSTQDTFLGLYKNNKISIFYENQTLTKHYINLIVSR